MLVEVPENDHYKELQNMPEKIPIKKVEEESKDSYWKCPKCLCVQSMVL